MEVLTETEGDVAVAAARLGMEEDDLEAQLDEWILERKRQREEELGAAQEGEQQDHNAPSELSSN